MASNVIIAPSNATYHTDSGRTTVSNYASNYSSATKEALSKYGGSSYDESPVYVGSGAFPASAVNAGSQTAKFLNDVVTTSGSSIADSIREAMQIANGNSAQSQAYAREMMDFQRESDQYAMNWSAQEAQKTREWQEQMSNTAHQREVDDLIKAGLNPVLSANAGASTPSGSTGQAYSSNGAMGTVDNSVSALFGNIINAAAQMQMNERSLETQMAMQGLQLASNERINHANNETSILNYGISAAATRAAAAESAAASRYGADISATNTQKQIENAMAIALANNKQSGENTKTTSDATRYSADKSYEKPTGVAGGIWSTIKDMLAFGSIPSTRNATGF